MRVLYLNPFSQEVSGPDESLRTLLAALRPFGLEPHVVLPALGPQVPRYEALGARVHIAPLAVLKRNLSFAAATFPARVGRSALAVGAIARRVRAELIHTNMEVLLEGGLAARALGLPHILHYRGNTLDHPRWAFDALTAIWTRIADHVFCISAATAEIFRRRGYEDHVEVLWNPVDLTQFSPRRASDDVRKALGANSGVPLVGTVGRLHPRKDLETFVRAAALVAARRPTVHFAIVGAAEAPVEESYRDRLQALVREQGLEGRLVFAGARRDIPEVMRALDVFVLSSRHEGFGRVAAEAMAATRAVVVTDEGALPELVERGRFGLCAAPGDHAAFAAQIGALLDDPSRATALGCAAAAAAGRFDANTVAARVWDRYRELVEER
jgi:glycosyltransferase involved in cell wall biosynthesis